MFLTQKFTGFNNDYNTIEKMRKIIFSLLLNTKQK